MRKKTTATLAGIAKKRTDSVKFKLNLNEKSEKYEHTTEKENRK